MPNDLVDRDALIRAAQDRIQNHLRRHSRPRTKTHQRGKDKPVVCLVAHPSCDGLPVFPTISAAARRHNRHHERVRSAIARRGVCAGKPFDYLHNLRGDFVVNRFGTFLVGAQCDRRR